MTELSIDEQRYLLDAFASSPTEWFRPRDVDRDHFTDRTIDQLVESLARRGLINGQPECHARLTDLGRTTASHLAVLAKKDWPRFYKRRRVRIALAAAAAALSLVLVVLKSQQIL